MDAYYSQRGQGPKIGQNDHDTREPDAVKAASPVRRGAVRKGLTDDTSLSKTGTVYGSISTSLAAYSTKLVTAALEWSYEAKASDVTAETLKNAAELLILRRDTLRLIDGAGPSVEVSQSESTSDEARAYETEERSSEISSSLPESLTQAQTSRIDKGEQASSP